MLQSGRPVTTNPMRSVTDHSAAVVVSGSKSSVVLYAHVAGGPKLRPSAKKRASNPPASAVCA